MNVGCGACEDCQYTCDIYCESCDTCQGCNICDTCEGCDIECGGCESYCEGCDSCDSCQVCTACDSCNTCQSCNYCDDCEQCTTVCQYCDACLSCDNCLTCDLCQSCNVCESEQYPVIPSVVLIEQGSNWIKIKRTVSDPSTNIQTYMAIGTGGTYDTVQNICAANGFTYSTTEPYLTVSNLAPSTNYKFKARGFKNGFWSSDSDEVTATLAAIRPNNFTGFINIAANADAKIYVSDWLSFCNKINEFRRYLGFANYAFTTSTTFIAADKDFEATYFNEPVNALSVIASHFTGGNIIPSSKSSGAMCYANYFMQLKNALNSIE